MLRRGAKAPLLAMTGYYFLHGIIVGGVTEGVRVFDGVGVLRGVGVADGVSVLRGVRVNVAVGVAVGVTVAVNVGGNNLVGVSRTSGG